VHTLCSRSASSAGRLAILHAALTLAAIFGFAVGSDRCEAALTSTNTTLTSTPNASIYGASVTFTATVSPSVPAGETVTFFDSGTQIGTGTTASSKATFVTAALTVGTHSITASYSGDSTYGGSTSTTLAQQVVICHPTTVLASSLNPSVYGSAVTFTATINQSVPNGETVTFYQGAVSKASIGTGATSGGVATLTISTLAAGSDTIWAEYMGDSNYAYSWSSSVIQAVNQAVTTTALASTVNPSVYGGSVTFTASISPSVPNNETVTFYDGATSIGTGKTASGVATLSTSGLAAGGHSITASYSGDSNYSASTSSALAQTVNPIATTTSLASSPNPTNYGAAVTFTATISPRATAGETVTFYDGAATIGTGTTANSKATCVTAALNVGSHNITATYSGDANYAASSSIALLQTVNVQSTTTSINSTPNPVNYGAAVTFTAWVRPIDPDGETITFYDGASAIGTGTTALGIATYTTSALTGGPHSITATYSGDANLITSTSSVLTQTVVICHPTTALVSSLNPSGLGSAVTLTATITPVVPDGETVTFYDGAAPNTTIGTGTVAGGVATFTTASLALGAHTLWAQYMGDANYVYSWSSSLAQTVKPASTTTLTSSLNPSAYGAAVSFSATVGPSIADGETVTFFDGGASIGTGTTAGGVAILAMTTLIAGSHSITANYPGDVNYGPSTSSALTQTVNQASPAIALGSSLNPSTYRGAITLTATISPAVPNGETVTFYDSGTSIGTGNTSGGVATLTTSTLTAGNHSITATYSGDTNYAPSTSTVLTQTVNQASTTTTLGSSPNPATYGGSVVFTATVSPSVPNSETVTFNDGGVPIGTGATSGGVAILATAALTAGSHNITGSYPGDANYQASASGILSQDIVAVQTAVTIVSSLNPSIYGAAVTFTATISPVVPDGATVTFFDSGTPIGTGTTGGGIATYITSGLTEGSHYIAAGYPSSVDYAGSMSSALSQTVNAAPTTTTLASSLNPSTFGTAVTFTATISPAVPNGETVKFYDGAAVIGAGPTSDGIATFATSALVVGSHSITASYPGDTNLNASTSNVLTQIVNKEPTTTTLSSSLNPSTYDASVTFTATVSPGVPNGETVTFYDAGVAIGTGTTGASLATFTTSALDLGGRSITASYAGDSNYATSTSSVLTQTVNCASTTTTLVSSPNPSVYGSPVTFTATISPGATDGVSVPFVDTMTQLAIGYGTTAGGVATCTTSTLSAGSYTIVASYNSAGIYYGPSQSNPLSQVVNQASTSTTLTSSLNPSTYGASVTFTATVIPVVPDGETVTFYDGATAIGTGQTTSSIATLTTAAFALGGNSITATYAGDTNYQTSTSAVLTQAVDQASTTTTLASSLNPSTYGTSVTFTATISPTVPNGETVTFYDGGVSIGTGTTSGGVAALATAALLAGSHSITATYAGDANYATSASTTLTQMVTQATTTTALISSLNPSTYGTSVTFTATVSPTAPDGESVTFYDSGVSIGTGTTASGSATLATAALAAASHTITATYAGDANYVTSTSSAVTQTVNQASTTAALASSLNPSTIGALVTLTATISPAVPNGETMTFLDAGTSIGTGTTSGGVATFATSTLAQGTHSITASYPGDGNYLTSTSATLTQSVNLPSTTTTLTSSLNPAAPGSSVTFTATIAPAVADGETVTFYDGATSIGTGTTSGGVATFTTSALAAGSHSMTASYPGDANYAGSTSSVLWQTIGTTSLTVHIDCGGPSYLDTLGITWSADNYSTGGSPAQSTASIAGTNDKLLYQYQETETSSGSGFTYAINVPSGSYFLRLLFAETVNTGPGQRVFDVTANGATILSGFDILAAAGNANTAVDRILPVTVGNSGLTLTFKGTTGLATVSGIALAQMPAGGGVITGFSIAPPI